MRSRRGKQGAPPCVPRNGSHQWAGRNVHGFIIHWWVCENCGMVMHDPHPTEQYVFIPPLIIQELGVRPWEAT